MNLTQIKNHRERQSRNTDPQAMMMLAALFQNPQAFVDYRKGGRAPPHFRCMANPWWISKLGGKHHQGPCFDFTILTLATILNLV